MRPEDMSSAEPGATQPSPPHADPDGAPAKEASFERLINEPGDAHQQQPLSTIKPLYLLTAVMVVLIIAAVLITIAIVKA